MIDILNTQDLENILFFLPACLSRGVTGVPIKRL